MALPEPRGQAPAATQHHDPRTQVVAWLNSDRIREQVQRALPDHVPLDWFVRAAQTAILNNPDLAVADKPSLLRELVAVAQLGLGLDPQLGEAWLIVDRKRQVQRRVGYQGLRKLALQSGQVTGLNAQAVYENDLCDISLGDAPSVTHKINLRSKERGEVIGCYALGKVAGTNDPVVEWMSWAEIEKHRSRYSDAYKGHSGPWADELGQIEMGRKTVFRRLCKWLPKSALLVKALEDEERAEAQLRVVNPVPERDALPAPEEPRETWADANTGEISRDDEAREQPDKPSWVVDGKMYLQPARVQTAISLRISACQTLAELEECLKAHWPTIEALPAANRQAVEHAAQEQQNQLLDQVADASASRTPDAEDAELFEKE